MGWLHETKKLHNLLGSAAKRTLKGKVATLLGAWLVGQLNMNIHVCCRLLGSLFHFFFFFSA